MQKKAYKILVLSAVFILATFLIAEAILRYKGIRPDMECYSKADPYVLFEPDTALGWKNKAGRHTFYSCSSGKEIFEFQINNAGNRPSCDADTIDAGNSRPTIYIYGSQYAFGFSIADSSTFSFKLQQLLPETKVINKSVTMYGLSQMYMSLRQSLSHGDTPSIVVISYADLDDLHTPLSKQMGLQVSENVLYGNTHAFDNCSFPYFEYKNNVLAPLKCSLNDFARRSQLVRYSSVILLLNSLYFDYYDDNNYIYRHSISYHTAVEMMQYCKANHIVPIFAPIANSMDVNTMKNNKPSTDIQDSLRNMGFYTIDFGIDIKEERYNTSDREYVEPNETAHSIFAKKINDLIVEKQILKQVSR